jgi:CRP/FNR family cyclic AMP-dependent transcriptional regulator
VRLFNPPAHGSLLETQPLPADDSRAPPTGDMDMHREESRREFWHLLTDSEQSALAVLGRHRTFDPGTTMCVEGEPAAHVFVVKMGWVKISSVTRDGNELLLALRGQGDIVGEFAGEANGYRTATLRAADTVHALVVSYENFTSFLDSHSGAGHAYRRVMTRGWRDTAAMLRSRADMNGSQRLAALLVDLAEAHGVAAGDAVEIEFPLTQEELASLVGASRATVTRALHDWRRRRIVRTGHRHITITNLAKLRSIARLGGNPNSGGLPLPQPSSPFRIRSISSRQQLDATMMTVPDRSREFLISTDDPSMATSTQVSPLSLARLLRHTGAWCSRG